jgi:hypothetical protein
MAGTAAVVAKEGKAGMGMYCIAPATVETEVAAEMAATADAEAKAAMVETVAPEETSAFF